MKTHHDQWLESHESELNSIAVIPPSEVEQAHIDACRFRWARQHLFEPSCWATAYRILRNLKFIP
jgi:hypothetical protein